MKVFLAAPRTAAHLSFGALLVSAALARNAAAQSPPAPQPLPAPSDPAGSAVPAPAVTTPPTPVAMAPATPAAPPAPDSAAARGVEWTSLRLLRDKGVVSEAEYLSALKDLGGLVGAGDATTLVVSKIKATLYGYVQADFIYNSTQSCQDFCSNFLIQKAGTYRGDHARVVFSPRDSRLGFRIAAPEERKIRVSGLLEGDFFGPITTTEQGTWVNPVLRVRHSWLKFETPIVDILLGQAWSLFGWQAGYLAASVAEPGLPGQLFQRTPQLRVSKTIKADAITVDLAVAAVRPPQMDSGTPEGVLGAKLSFPRWTGQHTSYLTATLIQPASIAVSADLRRFRIPEFSTAPTRGKIKYGGGVAFDAYLPIVTASKDSKANALSVVGEFAIGSGTSDMYTALGAAGTSNAAIPPAVDGGAPGTYVPNLDPGFAAYDAAGNLELIQWTSYFVGAEFYPDVLEGRLGTFVNYGHMQSSNSDKFGGASVKDPVLGRTRESEDFFNAGLFFDPTKATRIGFDAALYSDHYVDGTTAKNTSLTTSAFLFF